MEKQNLVKQLLGINATDAVFELQITHETGGDVVKGIPTVKTVKKHRLVSAQLIKKVRLEWISMGIAESGDVTLVTGEEMSMTNQIEHDSIVYNFVNQVDSSTLHGKFYSYILRRV